MTHLITEQRLKMRALGYSPIPLNGKIPQIISWPNLGDTTDHQIEAWERVRPAETNTGLLTRNNPAFDVDILSNADAAQAVADLIDEWLRARGRIMVRFGRKPKRAIVCRTDAPFKKIRVELESSVTDPRPARSSTTPSRFWATVSSSPASASIPTPNSHTSGSEAPPFTCLLPSFR